MTNASPTTLTPATVMATITSRFPDALVVSTCGYISRQLFAVEDRPSHIYLVGSMGMAAPVGGGLAMASGRRVLIFDGDGSFAMNLGALPMIASHGRGVVHVVLDNGCHDSTGGQKMLPLDPAALARAAGYASTCLVRTEADLALANGAATPLLVHAKVARQDHPVPPRVPYQPGELTLRLADFLNLKRQPSNRST